MGITAPIARPPAPGATREELVTGEVVGRTTTTERVERGI
jgi:hypothetical protein